MSCSDRLEIKEIRGWQDSDGNVFETQLEAQASQAKIILHREIETPIFPIGDIGEFIDVLDIYDNIIRNYLECRRGLEKYRDFVAQNGKDIAGCSPDNAGTDSPEE